jgi:hypothetical protein
LSLTSFDNFIESEELSRIDRITRDLKLYISQRLGSSLYARSEGSTVGLIENSENSVVYDLLIKVRLVEMVARYNQTVTEEFQAVTSAEMLTINRDGNKLDIHVGFVPFVEPNLDLLRALTFNFGV